MDFSGTGQKSENKIPGGTPGRDNRKIFFGRESGTGKTVKNPGSGTGRPVLSRILTSIFGPVGTNFENKIRDGIRDGTNRKKFPGRDPGREKR